MTAVAGCAAYAGIPLTHRVHAQTLAFATGHLKDGSVDLDWQALARPRQTVFFYVGIGGISIICHQMIAHGLHATHPVAVVQSSSIERQQVLVADLTTMPDRVTEAGITSSALIIVGSMVKLHTKLAWYEATRNAEERHKQN